MIFRQLVVSGFRSFREPQTFTFGDVGLVYITGANLVEPELGANGIGKSTLFEALHWVLYGKTSRNLRASEVANWADATQCMVELQFDDHILRRTWNPNTLRLDDVEISQPDVEQVLGLSEDAFLYAIYHAQFVPHFADRGPTAQLEIFSDVLRLHVWEQAAERANDIAKKEKEKLSKFLAEVADLSGSWREVRNQLDELEDKETDWWRERLRKQRQLWATLADRQGQLDKATFKEAGLVADLNWLTIGSPTATERSALEEEIADRLAEIKTLQAARSRLDQREFKAGQRCPTCYQPVDLGAIKAFLKKERARLDNLLGDVKYLQAKTEKKLVGRQKKYLESRKELETGLRKLQDTLADLRAEIKALRRDVAAGAVDSCPFDSARIRARHEQLAADVHEAKQRQSALAWTITAHEFWVKAFREIRLSLVNEALLQFELTTNSALSAFGLSEWAIEYDVQSETKGGKVNKGFIIYVRSPYNDAPVPFTAWSGGESQRLRLAIALGLSDLIQDFLGVHSNVEIFDEPTAWLSGEGINDLLGSLAERAADRKCSILLADHKALDYPFASIVSVVKDVNGSRLNAQNETR